MQTITCPNCHTPISLDKALQEQLDSNLQESQKKLEHQLKAELWAKAQAEAKKRAEEAVAEDKKRREELQKAEVEVQKRDQETKQKQLAELQERLREQELRAKAAEQNEVELRKKHREIEERGRQLELEIQRKLDQQLKTETEKVARVESERFFLKEKEYQKQISDMKASVEEARLRATTVSQQLQGEVLELELEQMLQETFPQDIISEVKKGQFGADMLQVVRTASGKTAGIIVWESKQTENFSEKWLPKLREDTRNAKGNIPVLVTRKLPDGITTCAERDHVWITSFEFVLPLATLLRQTLLKVDQEKLVQSGKEVKAEMLFSYINSHEFRGRVEAIVESFREMKDDLEKEQRALMNSWKKRDKQILRLATNTAYMYGEMQGVVGASLPDISGLALESGEDPVSEQSALGF